MPDGACACRLLSGINARPAAKEKYRVVLGRLFEPTSVFLCFLCRIGGPA